MMNNKHYFFKFKEGNSGFVKLLKSKDYNKHKNHGNHCPIQ